MADDTKIEEDDKDQIVAEVHGGQVLFNRKMFKTDEEWQKFRDTAAALSAKQDQTEQRKLDADYAARKAEAAPQQLVDAPAAAPAATMPDEGAARADAGRDQAGAADRLARRREMPRREGREGAMPAPADRSKLDTSEISTAGRGGRFFQEAIGNAARVALPEDGADLQSHDPAAVEPARGGQVGTPAPISYGNDGAGGPRPDPTTERGPANWIPAAATAAGGATAIQAGPALRAGAAVGIDPFGLNQAPPPAAPPPPDGGAPPASAAATAKPPGGGGGGVKWPASTDYEPEMRGYVKKQVDAINAAADLHAAAATATGKIQQAQQEQLIANQVRAQKIQEFTQAGMKDLIDSTHKAQEILNNPAKTPNPEHYWENHSKIMFAIGVGLMAAGKGDVSAMLNHVQQAINRDMKAQEDAFNAPRKAAEAKIAGNKNLIGMLRDYGLDSYEAMKVGTALSLDLYNNQISQITSNTDSQLAKTNGQQMGAQLQQNAAKALQEAQQHRQTNDVARVNAESQRRAADAEMIKARAAAAKEGAGGLTKKQQDQIADLRQQAQAARGYVNDLRNDIQKYGTVELTGSNSEVRDHKLQFLATALAKLADPDGVARSEKVKVDRETFGISPNDFMRSTKSDMEIFKSLEREINQREHDAYALRGLPVPPETPAVTPEIPTSPVR